MFLVIEAKPGEIAETVLLPGDPLRAKFIAEEMLENVICYNKVRGMYGFTGTYKGKKVSVQGTGMGQPSMAIYANELISEYQVKNLIRVGTCGAIQPDLNVRDVVLAMAASTNSNMNRLRFHGDYAPCASFSLLKKAYEVAREKGITVQVGSVLTSDNFYNDDPDFWKQWAAFGVLAIEMEAAALYTIAAKFNVRALAICTVRDSLITKKTENTQACETGMPQMAEIALELVE